MMLDAALQAASRGLRLIALHNPDSSAPFGVNDTGEATGGCSCRKLECESAGKHPRILEWQNKATTDQAIIRRWSIRWPNHNLGVACGQPGFVVLDIDPRNDGDHSLELLERKYGTLPETATVRTGSGGTHYYFAGLVPKREIAPGIDLQGEGSYVVIPPSLHACGGRYRWERQCKLAPLPHWLIELVSRSHVKAAGTGAVLADVIPKGSRNKTLFRCACAMRRHGFSEAAILAALRIENSSRCSPPLVADDIATIAKQAAQYDPAARQG